jgi:two-component system, chemotaxis family, chemotaxis protein CheY
MRKLSVLVVDDNRNMRSLVRAVLLSFGISRVSEAVDGADGLDQLRTTPIDLIITDYSMQPLNGVEFTRFVRSDALEQVAHIPIIMLTGHTRREVILAARDSGVDEMLSKPISANALWSRMQAVVNDRRPFVRASQFFGPCRRRFTGPAGESYTRRQSDQA